MRPFLAILLLLFLAACAGISPPVWTSLPAAKQLLERLQESGKRFHSLEAEASVSLTSQGRHLSSQQFLLLEKPDRVRVDVLTGFGQVLLQLASDGERLSVLLNNTAPGHFFSGPATDENIARFTQLNLPVESLVRLLLYDPPLVEAVQTMVIPKEEKLLLILETAERRQELFFDHQLQLLGSRYLLGTELLLEIQYQQIAADGFPRQVVLDLAREQTRISMRFTDLKTNMTLSAEKFVLKKPEKLSEEPLP